MRVRAGLGRHQAALPICTAAGRPWSRTCVTTAMPRRTSALAQSVLTARRLRHRCSCRSPDVNGGRTSFTADVRHRRDPAPEQGPRGIIGDPPLRHVDEGGVARPLHRAVRPGPAAAKARQADERTAVLARDSDSFEKQLRQRLLRIRRCLSDHGVPASFRCLTAPIISFEAANWKSAASGSPSAAVPTPLTRPLSGPISTVCRRLCSDGLPRRRASRLPRWSRSSSRAAAISAAWPWRRGRSSSPVPSAPTSDCAQTLRCGSHACWCRPRGCDRQFGRFQDMLLAANPW